MKETKSFRSLLGRARGLGAAKSGTHHWWMQRVTAIALIALWLYLTGDFFMYTVFGGYELTIEWLRSPYAATGIVLFLIAGFYHAALGIQVVIEDYVHCETSKTVSILLVKFFCAAFAILGILSTAKVFFGA